MNGEYIASFSNFGKKHVDIGAPGVAILSLVPSAYSLDGKNIYSPSSGTSMAAPYISNLAAQILNINLKLKPEEIKKIILETGDEKDHLKEKMISASIVNNDRAIKAALLSKDLPLEQAIGLAKTGLVPIEDSVSFGQPPAIEPLKIQQKVMDSFPKSISPQEIEEIQETHEDAPAPTAPETKVESAPQTGTSN
jgi:subtilisin family serine protease